MKSTIRIGLGTALLAGASAAFAGGPLGVCNNAALKYSPATVTLNYDQGTLGTRTKAAADALVTAAVANWTNVTTATITVARGGDLPVDVTTANYLTYVGGGTFQDGVNPVVYDTDGSITDLMLGTGANNSVLGFAGSASFTSPTCRYAEGRAVINGKLNVSDTTMRVVLAHEIGHLIGMDHSQIDNSMVPGMPTSTYPLMYPIAFRSTDALHEDDVAAVSAIYPDTTLNSVYGTLSGTLTQTSGAAVRGANVWARETTTGKTYSIVSDYLLQGTGFFKLLLPAGTYRLRVSAIDSGFDGGSSVGPYTEDPLVDPTSPGNFSFQPPLYNGGVPMATVTLGNSTPTLITITPGCSATVPFKLNGTGTVTGNCVSVPQISLNVGKAGTGSGAVTSSPAGINCGSTCSTTLASGTSVTLTATPDSGSVFGGWTGACTGGATTCTFTLASASAATATFTKTYTGTLIARYRLYNGSTLEHLYTTDANEYAVLASLGWQPEGAIYKVFNGPGSIGGVSAVPYYRLYNPSSSQHHWTTDANEYAVLATLGWQQEGTDGYILPAQAAGTVPLYRLYIGVSGGLHLWTTDLNEKNVLTTTRGWTYEGIAGYVLPLP